MVQIYKHEGKKKLAINTYNRRWVFWLYSSASLVLKRQNVISLIRTVEIGPIFLIAKPVPRPKRRFCTKEPAFLTESSYMPLDFRSGRSFLFRLKIRWLGLLTIYRVSPRILIPMSRLPSLDVGALVMHRNVDTQFPLCFAMIRSCESFDQP